jgi:hypothetical protein
MSIRERSIGETPDHLLGFVDLALAFGGSGSAS